MPRTGAPTLRAHVARDPRLRISCRELPRCSQSASCSAELSASAPNPVNDTLSLVTPHLRSDRRSLAHAAMARARAARAACQDTHALPADIPPLPRLHCATLACVSGEVAGRALHEGDAGEAAEPVRTSLMGG